jgi:hypothetical protein
VKTSSEATPAAEAAQEKKPGLFQRLYEKLDRKMKEKAEASPDCCCCEGEDGDSKDGGKCC